MDQNNGTSGDWAAQFERAKPISIETKNECLELFKEGYGYHRAANALGLKRYTVRDWMRRYKQGDTRWATTDGKRHWRRIEAIDLLNSPHENKAFNKGCGQTHEGDGPFGHSVRCPGRGADQAAEDAGRAPEIPPVELTRGVRELLSRVNRKKKELEAVQALVAKGHTKKDACMAAGIPRCEYYRSLNQTGKAESDLLLIGLISEIEGSVSGTYGVDRMTAEVNRRLAGMGQETASKILGKSKVVNRKRIHRLMKLSGIHSRLRRKRHPENYYSGVKEMLKTNMVPNVLAREFSSDRPLKKCVTDVTYIQCADGKFLYLSVLKDMYNKEIISHTMSTVNSVGFVLDMLARLPPEAAGKMLIHSDQGCLYWSNAWVDFCKKRNITRSMSRRGNCWDNAPCESFFSQMKADLGLVKADYKNLLTSKQVMDLIDSYIQWYNGGRIQKGLGYRTPLEVRQGFQGGNIVGPVHKVGQADPEKLSILGEVLPALALRATPSGTAGSTSPRITPGMNRA